ncbi:hypothetical protein LCGC14_2483470 [marine sediment metagenome]|uniref:Uncharacterized protein n=1 Tax=marine sediment metagenome TaxID=412755 RepID=A0A0F9B6S9_9ZZZZ
MVANVAATGEEVVMIPTYIDLTARQAHAIARGDDSFDLTELPNIKVGSVLWLREPWMIDDHPIGAGLSQCFYRYQAEEIAGSWYESVAELMGWKSGGNPGWRPPGMMPISAIRFRRQCTLVKKVVLVGRALGAPRHIWHIGIGPLEDEG